MDVKWLSAKKLERQKMGEHKQKLFSFRTNDELIEKLNIIAEKHSRTRNKEIEYALKQYVEDYETQEGKINLKNINIDTNNGTINM